MQVSQATKDTMKLNHAVQLLDSAIVLDSTYVLAYSNKASLLFELKKYYSVLATLDSMEKYSKESAFINFYRGTAYKYLKEEDKSLGAFTKAIQTASKMDTYQNKTMYFHLYAYFHGIESSFKKIDEAFNEGKLKQDEYETIKEIIKGLDENNILDLDEE